MAQIHRHEYDVVVIGAGGSGLRAAVGLSEAGLKTPLHSGNYCTPGDRTAVAGRKNRLKWKDAPTHPLLQRLVDKYGLSRFSLG